MTTLHERSVSSDLDKPAAAPTLERRRYRRHDLEQLDIQLQRWDGMRRSPGRSLGRIINLSAGGVRVRTSGQAVRSDNQIRVRMELPAYAGICPFVDTAATELRPKREWIGWIAVTRVQQVGPEEYDIAGTLIDMEEIDRGMLGLYLSTQPLAA